MSCRNLLLKLARGGYVTLPAPLRSANNYHRHRNIQFVVHQRSPIIADLQTLRSIYMTSVQYGEQQKLFKNFLARYHYHRYSGTVGENIKYLAFDRNDNPFACLLFGAAAWNIAPRDRFIGWDAETRKRNLHLVTNNMRFLILPWIGVPHLASQLLGQVARRICADWLNKYGHPIYVLEIFVEHQRFSGTCYQAANWRYVGKLRVSFPQRPLQLDSSAN